MDATLAGLIETILQTLATGLLIGCLYGLMCVGLGMIFGLMRVINFAHGDFMMLGMYAAILLAGYVAPLGPFGAAVCSAALAGLLVAALGWLVQRGLLAHASGVRTAGVQGGGHYAQLTLTLGIALVLQNGALIVFGSTPRTIASPLSSTAWQIGTDDVSIFLNHGRMLAACVALVCAVGLYLFVNRTPEGKALRAASDNPIAATYVGIDVQRAHRIAFAIGTGIAAVAGALLATSYPAQPYIGLDFIITMFAGVVLGGLGSILGAFWGGLTIGIVQQVSALVLPTQLQNTAIFAVFLLIILYRPNGFFGRSADRT